MAFTGNANLSSPAWPEDVSDLIGVISPYEVSGDTIEKDIIEQSKETSDGE